MIGLAQDSVASGSTVYPYTPLWLTAKPTGTVSNLTTTTGWVTFALDGQSTSVPLNVSGTATWITPMTASSGNHSVVGSYAGDESVADVGLMLQVIWLDEGEQLNAMELLNSLIILLCYIKAPASGVRLWCETEL